MSSLPNSIPHRRTSSGTGQGEIQRIFVRQGAGLHETAKRGIHGDVEKLIASGQVAVGDVDQFGQTALHIASFEGHLDIVNYLIAQGASTSVQDKNGWTPLHCAANKGHLSICERLLSAGADPNALNSSGSSALHYLANLSLSDQLVYLLNIMIKKDAIVAIQNEHGTTPLHNACHRSGEGVAIFLLLNGANPDSPTFHKECPIHIAARLGKMRLVEALITFGASTTTLGPDGNAEETARRNGHDALAEYIHHLKDKSHAKKKKRKKEDKALKRTPSQDPETAGTPSNSSISASTATSKSSLTNGHALHASGDSDEEPLKPLMEAPPKTPRKQHSSRHHRHHRHNSERSDHDELAESSMTPGRPKEHKESTLSPESKESRKSASRDVTPTKTRDTTSQTSYATEHNMTISIDSIMTAPPQTISGEEDESSMGSTKISTPTSRERSAKINNLMKIFQAQDIKIPPSGESKRNSGPRGNSPVLGRPSTPKKPGDPRRHSGEPPLVSTGSSPRPGGSPRLGAALVSPTKHRSEDNIESLSAPGGPSPVDRKTSPVPALVLRPGPASIQSAPSSSVYSVKKASGTSQTSPIDSHSATTNSGEASSSLPVSSSFLSGSNSRNDLHHDEMDSDGLDDERDTSFSASFSPRSGLLSSRSLSTDVASDAASDTGSDTKLPSGRRVGDSLTPRSPRALSARSSSKPALDRSTSDILTKHAGMRGQQRSSPLIKGLSRLPSSEFGPRSVQRVSKTGSKARHSKPFTKFLKDINFDKIIAVPEFPMPPHSSVSVADSMIIPNAEYYVEASRPLENPLTGGPSAAPSNSSSSTSFNNPIMFSDDLEPVTWHYKSNFFDETGASHAHWNFVAYVDLKFHPTSVPMIVSLVHVRGTHLGGVLGLIRTISGDTTFTLDIGDRKPSSLNAKRLIKMMLEQNEAFKTTKWYPIKDPALSDELLDYEKAEKNQFRVTYSHKVGIIYVKEGQITEEEILGNKHGSDLFEQFLDCIGQKIDLAGWSGFDGGLDTRKDRTGKRSVFANWKDFDIMFHVSTYLPLGSGEEKYVEKKKYIGNDMTTIVFLDTQSTAFKPPTLSGDFLHNFIVIHPHPDGTFSVSIAARKGTPEFGPVLPAGGLFTLGDQLKEFLLSKIINAERATLLAPMFLTKRRQARHNYLSMLVNRYMPSK